MIKIKNKIFAFTISIFFMVSHGANSNIVNEKIAISSLMKEQIMSSSFKVSLRRDDGKKIVAYLYAEDEPSKPEEYYQCINGESKNSLGKTGHYYIYLYDVSADLFFPSRTAVFHDFDGITLNIDGTDLFVLTSPNKNKSDVLLISQFGACDNDFYEAYGFSENQLFLKNYIFVGRKKREQFHGRVGDYEHGTLIAYSVYGKHNKIHKLSLSLSNIPGEIRVKAQPW